MRTTITIPLLLLFALPSLRAQEYTTVRAFPNLHLVKPVGLVHPDDGSNHLFVIEQQGIVKVFENDSDVGSHKIFLDLQDRIIAGGEMGLLGLAFHPDHESNGYFYVNYTAPNPLRTVISRFQVRSDNPLAVDPASERIILTYVQPSEIHNGGQLAFGPDGYLYIASGDGGGAGDPENNAQNRRSLLGKILRIDVNMSSTEQPYMIPPGNPYYGSEEYREEIYAYGFRNPWRFSFDPVTGFLWCGDVGQDSWEEVDVVEPGRNYGWRIMEGFHCYGPSPTCDTAGLTIPIWEYLHTMKEGYAITGGYVYRGSTLTPLIGKYIYGDFATGRIWAIEYDGASDPVNTLLLDSDLSISSFGVDRDNELYICTYGGAIYQLAILPAGADDRDNDAAFHLDGSQPNPVTTSARITYTLERAAHVSLTLHDMMGRELYRVVDARQNSGAHEVKLDAARLAAGTYYYRLASTGKVATRRLVVVR